MKKRYEVRLSGSGGQGMILAGVILAEAAAIYDNKQAIQSQSYGPEARGGASKSEVIISDEAIDFPKAIEIDTLVALTQEACDKYHGDLKQNGNLIIDNDRVWELPKGDYKLYKIPFVRLAKENLGKEIVANIIMLGSVAEITGIVSETAIRKAVLARVPKGSEELNRKALEFGIELAKNYKGDEKDGKNIRNN
ncbi:MAG: 2-oxoacid:acceptor oxidoreductase family protein [Pseudomonadota bacterium]